MNNGTDKKGVYRLRTCLCAVSNGAILLCLTIILAACEAPLDLSGVEAQLSRPTQRTDLFQAAARHQDVVVAVGGMGTIVRSTDGGESWQRTTVPGKPFLVDVAACPDGTMHAIEKTDGFWTAGADGEWSRQPLPEMTEPTALACDASNAIWVTGGFSTILSSKDTGASWESWSLDEDLYLTTIQFVDAQNGVATGEFGTVLRTSDGGVTWSRATDLPDSFYPQGAFFTSPARGWVVGLNGTIWETGDGAQSWQQAQTGVNAPLYGISGFGDTLVAVGDNTTVLYYRMGDAGWTPLDDTSKSRTYLRGIAGLDGGRFVTVGGGVLFTITIPLKGELASLETLYE